MSFGARFLRQPDLLPARLAGEVWGERALTLWIAGDDYRLSGLAEAHGPALRRAFAGFAAEAGDAGGAVARRSGAPIDVRLFRVAPAEFRRFDTSGWELTLDLDHAPDAVSLAGLGLMARIEWRPALRAGLWTAAAVEELPGVVENLLRVLAAYRLVERGGALLHSAGVVDGVSACLFLGRSGAGKTTLSGLSMAVGKTVLSDDLNAVVPSGRGFALAAVPFAGDFRSAAAGPAAPLRGLFRLVKGGRRARSPLGAGAALSTLVACAPYVNRDPFRLDRLLANLAALARAVPAEELTFTLAGDVWAGLTPAGASA